jgi:uncharacterized membrane protein
MAKSNSIWRNLLALIFIGSGVNHLWHPVAYLVGMPPYLPWPLPLIYISGVIAIVLGILLMTPQYSVMAAWGMVVWLIAVFPANVHMASNSYLYLPVIAVLLWLRLPLQFLLILWVYRYTQPEAEPPIK